MNIFIGGKIKLLNSNMPLFETKVESISSFVTKSPISLQNLRESHPRKSAVYSYSFVMHRSRNTGIWQTQSLKLWIKTNRAPYMPFQCLTLNPAYILNK